MNDKFNQVNLISKQLQQIVNDKKYDILELKDILYYLMSSDKKYSDAFLSSLLMGLELVDMPSKDIKTLIDVIIRINHYNPFSVSLSKYPNITCVAGSGKKYYKTLNITTLATIVASGLGAVIVKPTSKGVTSRLGSEDLLSYLKLPITNSITKAETFISKNYIAFFSIENLIPKFDAIYGGRQLTISPLSNALPGLMSPISCQNIYFGLSSNYHNKALNLLRSYGIGGNISISSTKLNEGYLDELTFSSGSKLTFESSNNSTIILEGITFDKADLNNARSTNNITNNINKIISEIKSTEVTDYMKIVCLNAAGILLTAGVYKNIRVAYEQAKLYVQKGKLLDRINALRGKQL
ncbi:MAG: hypothetical protein N4R76_04330 [Lactobacillus iners]|nr:hypothetical protein [Lactobacillus iners]